MLDGKGIWQHVKYENIAFWWTKNIAIEKFERQSECIRIWNALHDSQLHFKCRIYSIGANCSLFYWTDHANGIWMNFVGDELSHRCAYVRKFKSQNHIPFSLVRFVCAKSSDFRFQFARLSLCCNRETWVEPLMSARARERCFKKKRFFLFLQFFISSQRKFHFVALATWTFGYVLVGHL